MTAALGHIEGIGNIRTLASLLGDPPPTRAANRPTRCLDCNARLSTYNVESDRCAPCQRRGEGITVRCVGGDE